MDTNLLESSTLQKDSPSDSGRLGEQEQPSSPLLTKTNQPHRYRAPLPDELQCGEEIDPSGEVGVVTFYCALPQQLFNNKRLNFSCRGRSVGYLVDGETPVNDKDLEETYEHVDPCFFDAGYSLAGRTGFQVWAGSRLLLESLCCFRKDDPARLQYWQGRCRQGARIVELGSGVALTGATLAAVGGQVLLTDLPTLVESAIWPNLEWNRNEKDHVDDNDGDNTNNNNNSPSSTAPSWLQANQNDDQEAHPVPIGRGWAAASALDWTKPVQDQLSSYNNIDLIVASDCVWLVSMLHSLLDTVQSILDANHNFRQPSFLMSFQRRDTPQENSTIFTTVDRVLAAMAQRGWHVECLAWHWAQVDVDDTNQEKDDKPTQQQQQEVFLFEIVPTKGDE